MTDPTSAPAAAPSELREEIDSETMIPSREAFRVARHHQERAQRVEEKLTCLTAGHTADLAKKDEEIALKDARISVLAEWWVQAKRDLAQAAREGEIRGAREMREAAAKVADAYVGWIGSRIRALPDLKERDDG